MLDRKFIDKIEELRHNTYSRITELQKSLCPMIKNIYLNYQFEYWYDGYKYNLWEDDTHLYAVHEIPYCYDNDIRNTVFIDRMDHLVEQEKVWPFLLFINGLAIQWSKIEIIHDYDYSYIKIHDFTPDYSTNATIVVFPFTGKNIRYGEDSNILTTIDRKGLYFKNGLFVEDTNFENEINMRIEITNKDTYFKKIDLMSITGNTITFSELPDGYIPTLDNVISFSEDGFFNHEGPSTFIEDIYKGAFNTFKFTPIDPLKARWAFFVYFTDSSKQSMSIYEREDLDRNRIFKLLTMTQDSSSDLWNKLIKPLIEPFDFDHKFGVPYEENIANATKYITQYDFRLWKDAFIKDLNVKSFCYKGSDFKHLANEEGHIRMSRKHGEKIEDVVIMFVNNRLYQYMVDITYTTNTIVIPTFGILEDDVVELILFTKCNNNILDTVVPDASTPVYIHPEYNLEDCYLMSDFCPDCKYDVPSNFENRKQYIIDFSYTVENSNYKINFANEEYYGKNLKVVPKHQYRYYRFKKRDSKAECKVILPTKFNYCHDTDRYLIFVNGKKIDKTEYTLTIMNENRPFDKIVLYVSTLLDQGDYIDIFYIPEILVEKYSQSSISNDGLLKLIDNQDNINYPTTYPLSKDTCMVFINGLKVNPYNIKDVSLNSMLIDVDLYKRNPDGSVVKDGNGDPVENTKRVDSVDNITIVEFVPGNKEVSGYLNGLYQQISENQQYDPEKIDFNKSSSDKWKELIEIVSSGSISGVDLKTLFGDYFESAKTDKSYKEDYADLRSVLYDVIIEYYLNRGAYTGSPFVYDFERDHFDGKDPKPEIKIVELFGKRDKLFEYVPTDNIAQPEDVIDGKKFMDPREI